MNYLKVWDNYNSFILASNGRVKPGCSPDLLRPKPGHSNIQKAETCIEVNEVFGGQINRLNRRFLDTPPRQDGGVSILLLESLGFEVNLEKSISDPVTNKKNSRMEICSQSASLDMVRLLIRQRQASLKDMASLPRKLEALRLVIPMTPLYYKDGWYTDIPLKTYQIRADYQ